MIFQLLNDIGAIKGAGSHKKTDLDDFFLIAQKYHKQLINQKVYKLGLLKGLDGGQESVCCRIFINFSQIL